MLLAKLSHAVSMTQIYFATVSITHITHYYLKLKVFTLCKNRTLDFKICPILVLYILDCFLLIEGDKNQKSTQK